MEQTNRWKQAARLAAKKKPLNNEETQSEAKNGKGNVEENRKQKPNKTNLNLKSSSTSSDSESSRPPSLKQRLRATSQPYIDELNFEFYLKSMSKPSEKNNQQNL